jgi:lipoprotein signal peptidase
VAEFSKHIRTLLVFAGAVIAFDLVTKEIAFLLLRGDWITLNSDILGFNLFLALNEGGAGGFSYGEITRALNIVSMCVVVVPCFMLLRPLSAIHPWSPAALGLIMGAALGNTASLIVRPAVVDFISYTTAEGSAIVFNLADVAAFVGIGALIPITAAIAARVITGEERRNTLLHQDVMVFLTPRLRYAEREVPIMVMSEMRPRGDFVDGHERGDRPSARDGAPLMLRQQERGVDLEM